MRKVGQGFFERAADRLLGALEKKDCRNCRINTRRKDADFCSRCEELFVYMAEQLAKDPR